MLTVRGITYKRLNFCGRTRDKRRLQDRPSSIQRLASSHRDAYQLCTRPIPFDLLLTIDCLLRTLLAWTSDNQFDNLGITLQTSRIKFPIRDNKEFGGELGCVYLFGH